MKMAKPTIITAGIDTSKAKLDIAVHGTGSAFSVTNDEAGLEDGRSAAQTR